MTECMCDYCHTMRHPESYRGGLNDIIRSFKEDKAKREGVEKRVRPFVAKGVEEKHEPTKKS